MIVLMSKKTKTYHRASCRYVSRISEKTLTSFFVDDEKVNGYRPCKCCCSMKYVYKDLSPECKSRLEDLFAGIESKEGLAGATPG